MATRKNWRRVAARKNWRRVAARKNWRRVAARRKDWRREAARKDWRREAARKELKLEKDDLVEGGDLAELCTITMLIVYPYAGTINFEICTQNTPTSNSNNFSNNQPNSACDLSCRANKQNKEREGAHRGEAAHCARRRASARFATQNTATSKSLAQRNNAFPYWIDTH